MDLPVSIRLNPFKLTEFEGQAVPWNKWGRILPDRPAFTLDPLLHAGAYYVQDSSSMFVGHIFRRHLPEAGACPRVLDLCAAPGGKTTDLAASLRETCGDHFQLISNEVMKQRAAALRDNVTRWGDPNVTVTSVDPSALGKLQGYFDIIVADVPCSGEGMFRKDEKAVEQWSEQNVELCAARARRILADAWPALRENGILILSTCTYNEKENDCNLEWAAQELGGEILPPDDGFQQYGVRTTRAGNLLKAGESLGEGQWVGALRKTATQSTLRDADIKRFLPKEPAANERKNAPATAPDPDAPLSLDFDKNSFPCVDVDRSTALKYLHRDTLILPDAPKGYNIICYRGLPLGFVKNLGSRCNNLLPMRRRILMDIK